MKLGFAITLISLALVSVGHSSVESQGWRGIVPLKSTCEDVKRILKSTKCEFPVSKYELADSRIVVHFSTCKCCDGWNVKRGMVRSISVYPLTRKTLSELNLETDYEKVIDDEVVGGERFINRTKGVNVYSLNGLVIEEIFYPASKDEGLRCRPLRNLRERPR